LVEALVGTIGAVFPSIHVVDVPNTFNTIVFATVRPTTSDDLAQNLTALAAAGAHPLLIDVLGRTLLHLQPTPESDVVFTDDWAPIEQLTNSMAIRFILQGQLDTLRAE
jgi:hypothetical protein